MRPSIFPSAPPVLYLARLFGMATYVVLLKEGPEARIYGLIVARDKERSGAEQGSCVVLYQSNEYEMT